jgi:hypothetical protein
MEVRARARRVRLVSSRRVLSPAQKWAQRKRKVRQLGEERRTKAAGEFQLDAS